MNVLHPNCHNNRCLNVKTALIERRFSLPDAGPDKLPEPRGVTPDRMGSVFHTAMFVDFPGVARVMGTMARSFRKHDQYFLYNIVRWKLIESRILHHL